MVFLHRHDPHVNAVVSHGPRQHLLEFVETDLTLGFPTAARFLRRDGEGVPRAEAQTDDGNPEGVRHGFSVAAVHRRRAQETRSAVTSMMSVASEFR